MKPLRLTDVRNQTARIRGLVLAYLSRLCVTSSRSDGRGLAACPDELAPFINAAAELVRGLILALAYSKLRHAGLTEAAEALRGANQTMGQALPVELLQSLGQGISGDAEQSAPEGLPDLNAQLQSVLSDFENAEALSDFIACLWGFWLVPETSVYTDRHPNHACPSVQSRRLIPARLPFGAHRSGADQPAGSKPAFRYLGLSPPIWPPPVVACFLSPAH